MGKNDLTQGHFRFFDGLDREPTGGELELNEKLQYFLENNIGEKTRRRLKAILGNDEERRREFYGSLWPLVRRNRLSVKALNLRLTEFSSRYGSSAA